MRVAVFLGPSLGAAEARTLVPGVQLHPPAGRGDVARLLRGRARKPFAIALIDGVFDSRPAVWHREILAALEEGIAVFGAASMGALRAAELWSFGMVGIGAIYRWFREGTLIDDAEVALLHADREHGYRPLTVPLVNVRVAAERARRKRVLSRVQAASLVSCAEDTFYQERTWPAVLAALDRWPARRAAFEAFLAADRPDAKADDARLGLVAAAEYARAVQGPAAIRPTWPAPSALVQARLGLQRPPTDSALLAAWARSTGIRVGDGELSAGRGSMREREEAALAQWVRRHGRRLFPGL